MIKMALCSCAFFSSLLASQTASAGLYTYSKISYPDSKYGANIMQVNGSGQFTANVFDASGSSLAPYIWSSKGAEVQLQTPGSSYQSEVLSLNDHGLAVGDSFNSYATDFATRATVWRSATASFLPGLGDNRTEQARDINNAGVIVGYSYSNDTRVSNALFWNSDGLHDLGTGGGISAGAYAINNAGVIVGSTRFSGGQQGTVWKDGDVTHIGTLGGTRSVLADVNDVGWAVGDSLLAGDNENWRAILWDGVALHDLGTLGGQWSSANNIGADGTVFGSSLTSSDWKQHATIWRDGSAIDLNDMIVNPADLGARILATAIGSDSKGNIYGIAIDETGSMNGTFVLTPVSETEVPEPAPGTFVLAGAIYFLLRRKKLATGS